MEQKWTENQRTHETRDMEYKALRFTQQKGPELLDTSDNELRDRMIGFRKAETEKKTNREIVATIQKHFEDNNTMPNEKPLKTVAGQFARYFENVTDNDQIMDSCRNMMIDQYSQICIRELHVKDVANMDELKQYQKNNFTQTEDGRNKLIVNSLLSRQSREFGVSYNVSTIVAGEDGPRVDVIGELRGNEGAGHHRAMDGMYAQTLIVDNTDGQMKNLTVRTFVDLGQEPDGFAMEITAGDNDDDFTKAVNSLGTDNELSM